MATLTRTPANTKFGKHIAVFTAGGNNLVGLFSGARFSIPMDTYDGTSVLDFDDYSDSGASGMSLSWDAVVEGALPIMATALSSDPTLAIVFRNARTGDNYAGTFVITQARWESGGTGAQKASFTTMLQGDITHSTPSISSAPSPRATQSATKFGKHVVSCAIGSGDYVNLFTDLSISVDITTEEGMAALDYVKYPIPTRRKVTVTASKVVEADPNTPGNSLAWAELARARAAVALSIQTASAGSLFTGTGLITQYDADFPQGPQKESVTVVAQSAVTQE